MNTELFSDAINQIDNKYYEEAMTELQPERLHLKWWKLHKVAACLAAVMLLGVLSFGTAFAVSADFREAVIGFFTGGFVELGTDEQGYYSAYFHDAGNSDPITVRDGQIYFVMDGSEINITEQCSETTYYSYETTDTDGNYHVILVGGTPDNVGWAELIFENGSTGTGVIVVGEFGDEEPAWLSSGITEFKENFSADADFRQAAISFLFPTYTENQLHEIDEGHKTGSFSMENILFAFLDKFNNENMVDNITAKNDNGFEYVVLANGENSVDVIVECTSPNEKLLVVMQRNDYKETTGLWQVMAYQILDSKTANEMIDNRQ